MAGASMRSSATSVPPFIREKVSYISRGDLPWADGTGRGRSATRSPARSEHRHPGARRHQTPAQGQRVRRHDHPRHRRDLRRPCVGHLPSVAVADRDHRRGGLPRSLVGGRPSDRRSPARSAPVHSSPSGGVRRTGSEGSHAGVARHLPVLRTLRCTRRVAGGVGRGPSFSTSFSRHPSARSIRESTRTTCSTSCWAP